MVAMAILILCAQSLLAKSALSQCCGRGIYGPPFAGRGFDGPGAYDRWSYGGRLPCGGYGALSLAGIAPGIGLAASYGGGLTVISSSPIAPTGLRVTSDNTIEGTLAVIGNLPFLGAVATDGTFTSTGSGAVSYGCGGGTVGITAENSITTPVVAPTIAPGPGCTATTAPFSLPNRSNRGWGNRGRYGCGFK